ncbi:cysteine desulfurase family protein [Demequina sediminicola]|uniref:cysteine desulfurase family protein n=1 Tax=Demequina sediminicola TaxID=1095026 RepID=UPI000782DFE4|nr:cysteine desulfurase family protein [Demequina sediminicola]
MDTHYLDHAATTPMLESAVQEVAKRMSIVGNPSAPHAAGRAARAVVDDARERLARAVDAHPSEVIWTSGGTEADNLALKGLFWARNEAEPLRTRVLVSAVEHHAVLEPAEWLEAHEGAELVVIPVDRQGVIDVEWLRSYLDSHHSTTAVISVMWANNEVGTIEPVEEVAALAHGYGIPVHTDAVQAVGHVPVSFAQSGVTALSLSAHKVGGPVGVGALVIKRNVRLIPVSHGGGQERQVRSGTLDAVGFAAAAVAVETAVASVESEAQRLRTLQTVTLERIVESVPDATLSGARIGPGRLPGNLHLCFPGADPDALMFMLDSHGILASTGAACSAGVHQSSHVLMAMGYSSRDAASTMRFSMGHTTVQEDLDALITALPEGVERARRIVRA